MDSEVDLRDPPRPWDHLLNRHEELQMADKGLRQFFELR